MLRIEGAMITAARYLTRRMDERRDELPFAQCLTAEVVLVPMPRSGLRRKGAIWPALELAEALLERGFGGEIRELLKRSAPIHKAATSSAGERPTAQRHFETMDVDGLVTSQPVVLVDDVVTRGATMVGAMSRLSAASAKPKIFGFAAARTISEGEVPEVFDPVVGTIDLRNGQTFRKP
jgi:predicted amidophosphoribosyltransferase